MSRRRFAPEVHQFIRENVKGRTCKELTAMVNQHFGERLFTESTMKGYKNNHHLKSGTPCGGTRESKFGADVEAYIAEIAKGRSRAETTRLINERFGPGTMTLDQVVSYMTNHKICCGRDTRFQPGHTSPNKGKKGYCHPGCVPTQFRKGNRPANAVPIGTERLGADGYISVKVQDGHGNRNWVQKHRLVWERANGPIPEGHKLIFLDGDTKNCALENLMLVTDAEHAVMCKRGLHFSGPELTKSSVLVARVMLAANKARQRRKRDAEKADR